MILACSVHPSVSRGVFRGRRRQVVGEALPEGCTLLRSPRQVKGMETQRGEHQQARRVTRNSLCACLCMSMFTKLLTPMFVYVYVFFCFCLLGVFSFFPFVFFLP